MAIFYMRVTNVTRGASKKTNACATVAYITGKKIHCDRNDQTYSYGHKERVLYSNTTLPEGAPEEWNDPEILWNEVENNETAGNARLAKNFIVALPNELNLETQKTICQDFCDYLAEQGIASTFSVHEKSDGPIPKEEKPENDHAHILIPDRIIGPNGKWACKKKQEYALDENGNRIPRIDPETGEQKVDSHGRKQWVRHSVESNPLDKEKTLTEFKKKWAELCNQYLDRDHQIDHRSYKERGLELLPQKHEGYYARKLEASGIPSINCEENRRRNRINQAITKIKEIIGPNIHLVLSDVSTAISQLTEIVNRADASLGRLREVRDARRAQREREEQSYSSQEPITEMDRSVYDIKIINGKPTLVEVPPDYEPPRRSMEELRQELRERVDKYGWEETQKRLGSIPLEFFLGEETPPSEPVQPEEPVGGEVPVYEPEPEYHAPFNGSNIPADSPEPVGVGEEVHAEEIESHHKPHQLDPGYDYKAEPGTILYARSDNQLVNEVIQSCQIGYSEKDLAIVADMVMYFQSNNLTSRTDIRELYELKKAEVNDSLDKYYKTVTMIDADEKKLEKLEVYKENKGTYDKWNKIKNPKKREKFKYQHPEVKECESAMSFLHDNSRRADKSIETPKEIRAEIADLTGKVDQLAENFRNEMIEGDEMMDEMGVVIGNLDKILAPINFTDAFGWKPTPMLDERQIHDLPEELRVSEKASLEGFEERYGTVEGNPFAQPAPPERSR